MKTMKKKKKIIKIKWVSVLIIFLVVLVLAGGTYLAFQMPIQNIIIKGTTNLSDYEIMSLAGIDNYPSFLKTTGSSIKKKLLENPYITDVSVHKKFLGVLELEITEGYAMYYDSASESLVLSNGNTVKEEVNKTTVPVLLNYVPDTKRETFISCMQEVDPKILNQISEILYEPNDYDKDRFLLYMDAGNSVYLTLTKFEQINYYDEVLPQLEGKKGILYLDSGNHFEIMES